MSEPLFKDIDKQVSQSRQLLKVVNIERELRLFACDCAEHVLHIYEMDYPTGKRPRKAIELARAYAIDKAIREQLAAATAAAWAAAGDAEVQWQRQHWDEMLGKLFD